MRRLIILLFLNICPAISGKCTDVEILQYFASSTFPWDNYRRISEAVYPPTKQPSLLINVRAVFVNESSPWINSTDVCGSGRKAGELNYKWSMACLYVGGGVSLNTMTFFSLATIYPQRRETELCLKLPQKCRSGVESEVDMKYFLSKLQSIAIRPTAPDTSKNTVKCITVHHPEDEFYVNCWSLFSEPLQNALCGVWIYILISSAVLSLCMSLVLNYYLKHVASSEDVKKLEGERETAAKKANVLIKDAAEVAKTAAKDSAVVPEVEERVIDWIESAWHEADKIVCDRTYEQSTAKAAEAIRKVEDETAAAAAMAAAAKQTSLVALEDVRAQAKRNTLKSSINVNDTKGHGAAVQQRGAEYALSKSTAENAADEFVATPGKEECAAAVKAAHWAAVAAKALAAKEVAAKAASAAQEALDKAAEAATPRATVFMLWIFAVGECVLFIFLVLIQTINCAKNGDWEVCKVNLGKDVGLWLYVVFFLLSCLLPYISYCIQGKPTYHNPSNENDVGLCTIVIHPSLFSSIHHLMWICLGIITEPFWAFPVFLVIGSCLFVIYSMVHSVFTTYQKVTWYPKLFSAGCILSFVVFMFAVMVVGQTLFSDSFISNVAQSILVLIVTLLFRYLQPPT